MVRVWLEVCEEDIRMQNSSALTFIEILRCILMMTDLFGGHVIIIPVVA